MKGDMLMQWSTQLELGIKEIDDQHHRLLDLMNEAQGLVDQAKNEVDCYDDIMAILNELLEYTEYHFGYEEELMEKANYEGLEDQKIQHDAFVRKIKSFIESDIDENQLKSLDKITFFLINWISQHILNTDSKYVGKI